MAEYGGMQSPFGAFTGGLFGGLRNTLELANAWEGLKQNRMATQREQDAMNAASAARNAMNAGGNGATNTTLPSVTDTGAAPTAGNSGRDANGRPDLSTVPRPKFMQTPISNPPLPQRKPTPPASQADVSSFERGSREGAAAPVSTAAATPATPRHKIQWQRHTVRRRRRRFARSVEALLLWDGVHLISATGWVKGWPPARATA